MNFRAISFLGLLTLPALVTYSDGALAATVSPAAVTPAADPSLLPVALFNGGTLPRLTQEYDRSVVPGPRSPEIHIAVSDAFDAEAGNAHWVLRMRSSISGAGADTHYALDLETGTLTKSTNLPGTAGNSPGVTVAPLPTTHDAVYIGILSEMLQNFLTFVNPPAILGYAVVTDLKPYADYVDAALTRVQAL